MKTIKVRLSFMEDVLGTASGNPELHKEFIASKAPNAMSREEEVAALGVDEVEQKEMTIFPKAADGTPFLYDYQIKGFFKGACKALGYASSKGEDGKKRPVNASSKLTAYKSKIDLGIFVFPRVILFDMKGLKMGVCQRPLRAQTAQGERIALASSETVPAGSEITFSIKLLNDDFEAAVREWLDYGELSGIGQWRNSGAGRFLWAELDDKGNIVGGNYSKGGNFSDVA